jgi:uncharacterized membrane protein
MSEKPSPSRPSDQQQAVRELFRNRNFKLLWTGQLLSQIGDQCLLIAAITLISNLSRSPLTLLIPAISMLLGSLIAVQTVFVMAGVVTMLAGVAAAFVLRGAARLMRQVTVT